MPATAELSFDTERDFPATSGLEAVEAIQERALNDHEDVRAAIAAIAAAQQAVRAAFSQYYPSVSLNFSAFLYRENFDDASKWTAVLNANLPIFTAGLIRADVREAWSALRQAALLESITRRQVMQDVQIAYQNVLASRARLTDQRTQVDAARDALNQAEASYRVGLATNLERLTAQSQLLNAELQLAGEQYDQSLLLLDLTRFVGRLGQRGSLTSGSSGQSSRNTLSTGGIGTSTSVGGANGIGTTSVP